MHNIISLYSDLKKDISNIESKFVAKHLQIIPYIESDKYRDDVKAYCILSHALFENYFEQIALIVMEESIERYINKLEITKPILSLLSYSNSSMDIEEKSKKKTVFEPNNRAYDRIKKVLEETKKQISYEIINNHGMSINYLPYILLPVHINITSDSIILASIAELAKARGEYAHAKVEYSLEPETAVTFVHDCLRLCDNVKIQAIDNLLYTVEYRTYLIQKLRDNIYRRTKFM